jgi:hypothetical protein
MPPQNQTQQYYKNGELVECSSGRVPAKSKALSANPSINKRKRIFSVPSNVKFKMPAIHSKITKYAKKWKKYNLLCEGSK